MRKGLVFVVLFLAVGCRTKLDSESTVNVELMDKSRTTIDAITKTQMVKIAAKANSGQFNAYVLLEKDLAEVEKDLDRGKVPTKVLASQPKATQADFQVTVPANERAVVVITSGDGKKTEVKLKISN